GACGPSPTAGTAQMLARADADRYNGKKAMGRCLHQHEVRVDHRKGEQGAVHAIQEAAVAGEDSAAVFDVRTALHGGFGEVTQLPGDVGGRGKGDGLPQGHAGEKSLEVEAS